MLKSSFKFAWRSIVKHKTYSILNIFGLTIAISSFYLLFLYSTNELSFDQFHENSDRIYRVISKLKDGTLETAMSGQPWGPNLVSDHTEFEAYTRTSFYFDNFPIQKGEEIVFEDKLLFVDSTFFEVFDFPIIEGSSRTVLDQPTDVVLTESMAAKYFDGQPAIGETIRVNFNGSFTNYLVSGIVKDPPVNSHLQFHMIFSKQAEYQLYPQNDPNNWRRHTGFTYVILAKGLSKSQAEALFPDFFLKHAGEYFLERYVPSLQPITDIHLHSDLFGEIAPNGNINYVKVAIFLSIFILLIGCVNYVNLNTALSVNRAKEVGTRKVMGAFRAQLTLQFLVESIVVVMCAIILVVIVLQILLPYLNEITGKSLAFNFFQDGALLIVLGLIVGLLSGIYPALILSGFKPSEVLKGKFQHSGKGLILRRSLIVFQFTLSLVLFVGTGIIYDQTEFIQQKDLGFDNEGVVILSGITTDQVNDKIELIRHNLQVNPSILGISATSSYPSQSGLATRYRPQGFVGSDEELPTIHTIYTDHEFIEAVGLQLLDGRNFEKSIATDSASFVINESAAKLFGWKNPIGQRLAGFLPGNNEALNGKVIGVVKDFHFESLHKDIKPLIIRMEPSRYYNILIKFQSNKFSEVLALIEAEWESNFPEQAFNYLILKENFNQLHQSDFQLQQIITAGAVLAVVIACLGLFGLATFLTQQKVKEIGIRKVLGANRLRLLFLLNKEFTFPIVIAMVIGTPLSFYLMNQWLDDFAYRVSFNFWLIPIAGLIILLIAWLTVSYKALEVTKINPVNALRQDG